MDTNPKKILVPIDFSDAARAALEYAVALRATGGSIELFHVLERPSYFGPEILMVSGAEALASIEQFAAEQAEAELRLLVEQLGMRGVSNVHYRVTRGVPAERIVEEATEFDLIVMGTTGRTGLAHLLAGSVAEKVVRLAPCPVLTVRASETTAQRSAP